MYVCSTVDCSRMFGATRGWGRAAAREPESKQNHIEDIYQLVVINNSLLASMASLSTYAQNNVTSKASEDFKIISEKIIDNLNMVCKQLKTINFEDSKTNQSIFKPKPFHFPANQITNDVISKSNNEYRAIVFHQSFLYHTHSIYH